MFVAKLLFAFGILGLISMVFLYAKGCCNLDPCYEEWENKKCKTLYYKVVAPFTSLAFVLEIIALAVVL